MDDQEIIIEFLIESTENLSRLEQEIVDLEKRPDDALLLGSIFRTIHSIKGACGFLGFGNLEAVTHLTENILSQLRTGEKRLTTELISLVLESTDAIKSELSSIEKTSQESGKTHEELRQRLSSASAKASCDVPDEATSEEVAPVVVQAGEAVVETRSTPAEVQPPPVAAQALRVEPVALPSTYEVVASAPGDDAERASSNKSGPIADSTIRVDVGHLDKVMNLVGELVLARNQILQYTTQQDDPMLNATAQRLNLITSQLQEDVMKARMQPIGVVWNKLPRVVRDLASSCGKQIRLDMDGAETELDKSIIEAIKDPLTHIIRNCCDHGIEDPAERARRGKGVTGTLTLRAFHEGGKVNIEIADDGGGIDVNRVKRKALDRGLLNPEQIAKLSDREAVNLVFLPGFSTAEQVTSISGRGVGMDVVKTNIEKIGGVVDMNSTAGRGTTIKIKIPLTLAIIPGLIIQSGSEQFVIPQASLRELLRLEKVPGSGQIEMVYGTPVYRRRGKLLPIVYLRDILKLPTSGEDSEVLNIVILQSDEQLFGLVVDSIRDTQEIVVKPLGNQLKGLRPFAGATIMGDGSVALILDVVSLGQIANVVSDGPVKNRHDANERDDTYEDHQTYLLFCAGNHSRVAVPISIVARLEEFSQKSVQRSNGSLVVQYRDEILDLICLSELLDGQPLSLDEQNLSLPVIVFSEANRRVGLIVDQILDIHSESLRISKEGRRAGISGHAVIDGVITEFLDLAAVLELAGTSWEPRQALSHRPVLLLDTNGFSRGLVRNYLELAGHPVLEAQDTADALHKIARTLPKAIVMPGKLRPQLNEGLLRLLSEQGGASTVPLILLCDRKDDIPVSSQASSETWLERFDRDGLIRSLLRFEQMEPKPTDLTRVTGASEVAA